MGLSKDRLLTRAARNRAATTPSTERRPGPEQSRDRKEAVAAEYESEVLQETEDAEWSLVKFFLRASVPPRQGVS
jgi:hypothetical protein